VCVRRLYGAAFAAADRCAAWPSTTCSTPLVAEIQCLVDRFVTDVPLGAIGILRAQSGADLLRAPKLQVGERHRKVDGVRNVRSVPDARNDVVLRRR